MVSSISVDNDKVFESGKVYTHAIGLSCCFRQWRAESHCKFLHGYALQVKCVFRSNYLDHRNWVVDFGSLKSFKGWLEDTFDHKTLVAEDDPEIDTFKMMQANGLCDLIILPNLGMEAFAYTIFQYLETWLIDNGYLNVTLTEVEVAEHDANFARYRRI